MVPYTPRAYRPTELSPALGHRHVSILGRSHSLGQTFDQMFGFSPALGDVIRLVGHGAASYIGIYVGMEAKGVTSVIGWVIGIGQGITAICDVISIGQRIAGTHPPGPTNCFFPMTTPPSTPTANAQ